MDDQTPAPDRQRARLLATYQPAIDAAYQRRRRRQCSRADFEEGYVAALLDGAVPSHPPAGGSTSTPADVVRSVR